MYKSPVPRRSFLPNDRWRKKGKEELNRNCLPTVWESVGTTRVKQVFEQYRSHLKILDARRLTWWRFLAENPPCKIQSPRRSGVVICVLVVHDVPSNAICPPSVPHLHEFFFSSTAACCSLCPSFVKD